MIRVYHYSGCSTCKQAKAWMKRKGIEAEWIELTQAPPSAEALRGMLERSGLPLRRLFNVSGNAYREGNFKERLGTMSEAEALEALAADGMLIKRPLLDAGERVVVGFDEGAWGEALGGS